MSKLSAIYSITNNVNGKFYIGSAVNLALRWTRHKYHLRSGQHNCTPLQNAWNKYGEDAFVFAILEIVHDPRDVLMREQILLDTIKPYKNDVGYNCCSKAGNTAGIKFSSEAKLKIAVSTKLAHALGCYAEKNQKQKGASHSPEHRAKIGASQRGHTVTPETRAKISASRTGKKYPRSSAVVSLTTI